MTLAIATTPNAGIIETTTPEPVVPMTGQRKWFDAFHVLTDINFDVACGERIWREPA